VHAVAEIVTEPQGPTGMDPSDGKACGEGKRAGTSGSTDYQGTASQSNDTPMHLSVKAGSTFLNLKALALQWDAVHRACDADTGAAESIAGEASTASGGGIKASVRGKRPLVCLPLPHVLGIDG
jgi:hypothetical protein